MKKWIRYIAAIILAVFGLLTLFLSSSVIFDLFGIRAGQGNYVLFIVWTNFVSSLLYLTAVFGFFKSKNWTTVLLGLSSLLLIVAFISFKFYINAGGIHEAKTVGAMIFRISITLIFTAIAYFTISKIKQNES